jgi:hypothetical protein
MLPIRLPESINCALSVLPETNTESLSNDHSNTERQQRKSIVARKL